MLDEYGETRLRQIGQIAKFLALVDSRTHAVAVPCFLVVSTAEEGEGYARPALRRNRRVPRRTSVPVGGRRAPESSDSAPAPRDEDSDGADGPHEVSRFVQWSFHDQGLFLCLPRSTISESEGAVLIRTMKAFFYEASDRKHGISRLIDLIRWNPIVKWYLYGDAQQAAEEAAWILFTLWRLPVDTRLYAKSGSYTGGHQWEQNAPLGQ